MSQFNFDATQVSPQGDRTPLPKGRYSVMATSSEIKTVKAPGTGRFINIGMKILDGPAKDKTMFTNLNIENANPVATQIGRERLSALCHVVGILQITDTAQLHGRPFVVDIDVDAEGKYNEVVSFLKVDGSPAVAVGAGGAPAGAPPPPWAAPGTATGGPPAPAPAPAPVPQPPPQPATPPPPAPMFYVANLQGQNLTPQPVDANAIRTMPQGLAQLQICPVGGNAWQPATVLGAAPAANGAPGPASGATPPWLQNPPPA